MLGFPYFARLITTRPGASNGLEPTDFTKISHIIYWWPFHECFGSEQVVQLHLIKTELEKYFARTYHRRATELAQHCIFRSRRNIYLSFWNSFPGITTGETFICCQYDSPLSGEQQGRREAEIPMAHLNSQNYNLFLFLFQSSVKSIVKRMSSVKLHNMKRRFISASFERKLCLVSSPPTQIKCRLTNPTELSIRGQECKF